MKPQPPQKKDPSTVSVDLGCLTEQLVCLDPLFLVLLGHTGVGKSASGNTLLQREAFVSKRSFRSVTTEISEQTGTVGGQEVTVVDTPGIMNNLQLVRRYCQELMRSRKPHVFLFILKIDRFTQEQEEALETMMGAVGEEGLSRGLLLFTGADTLGTMTLKEFISEDPDSPLVKVVQKFGDRVHMFNNTPGGPEKNQQTNQEQVLQLMNKIKQMSHENPQNVEMIQRPEVRLVLVGLPGAGKSSSGNTILGSEVFGAGCGFDPMTAETLGASAKVGWRRVTVVDTPGFSRQNLEESVLFTQIMEYFKVVGETGLNAFVLVVPLARLQRESCLLLTLMSLLLEVSLIYFTVFFTHGDDAEGQDIDDLIRSNETVKELVSKCGGRYSVFNNKQTDNLSQVQSLLRVIDQMHTNNGGQLYTAEMLDRNQQTLMENPANLKEFLHFSDLPLSLLPQERARPPKTLRDRFRNFLQWIRRIIHWIVERINRLGRSAEIRIFTQSSIVGPA